MKEFRTSIKQKLANDDQILSHVAYQNYVTITRVFCWLVRVSLLPSATKLRRLCFYRCLSVQRGVWLNACWDTTHPPAADPPGADTPSGPGTPPPKQTPRNRHPKTATAADGMHPTGMYSCSLIWGSHEIWGQGGGESLALL